MKVHNSSRDGSAYLYSNKYIKCFLILFHKIFLLSLCASLHGLLAAQESKFYLLFFFFLNFKIHWFSIFNSFMMVIFLVGLVSMILMRTLRKDYARYSKEEDLDDMVKIGFVWSLFTKYE